MKIKTLVLTSFLGLAGLLSAPASAQERTASQPTFQPAAPVNAGLQMQVTTLTQLVQTLQGELNKCRLGLAGDPVVVTQTTITRNHGNEDAAKKDTETDKEKAEELTACNARSPVPPTSRRGYQAAAEHLSCEDYSHAYFLRHPAMATVCGVDTSAGEQPEPTVSTTQAVSSTLKKPAATSATLPTAAPAR